jgi:hypothetical protein
VTSEWCRTRETAELLNLGSFENVPVFDNLEFNKVRAAELLNQEREFIASWRGPGVLLIVTHGSNIKALTGIHLDEGDMIVTDPVSRSTTSLRFDRYLLQNTTWDCGENSKYEGLRHKSFEPPGCGGSKGGNSTEWMEPTPWSTVLWTIR